GDPGLRMGKDHAPMDAPPGRAQILGGFDLIGVEGLNRVVQRKEHEQDIGIDEADDDAAESREPADRRLDDAEPDEAEVQGPLERQDDEPGEGPQDLADPERDEKQQEQRGHYRWLGDLGQIISQRIGDEEAEDRDQAAVEDRRKEDVDMDGALEEGQIVVEAVEILRASHLYDRQIGPEGVLEEIEVGKDHERQEPEGRQRHESGRQRPAVAGEEIPHDEAPASGTLSSASTIECAGSKTRFIALPGGGTLPAPSLRASTTSGRPWPFWTWLFMKFPSKATSATVTGMLLRPGGATSTSLVCSGRT